MAVSIGELERVTDLITMHLGYLEVLVARWGPPLPWSCDEVVQAQERGEDPTGPWREAVTADQTRLYGAQAPPQVAAAFVMQWYLSVVANPLAWTAVASRYVLNGDPGAIHFDLSADSWYPCAVSVSSQGVDSVADDALRLTAARARYREHAERFIDGYRPEVKVGSGQRRGMIHDAWVMAAESAQQALGSEPVTRSWRKGCCFIYALPGAQPCARCPRLARVSSPS